MRSCRARWALCGIVLVACGGACAETLHDPMQPPALAVPGSEATAAVPVGPVLQSVMLAPGRKVAVISGQAVRVGEKYEEMTLIRLSDQEAVLRSEDGTLQTLKMHPAIDKKVIRPAEVRKPVRSQVKREPVPARP